MLFSMPYRGLFRLLNQSDAEDVIRSSFGWPISYLVISLAPTKFVAVVLVLHKTHLSVSSTFFLEVILFSKK